MRTKRTYVFSAALVGFCVALLGITELSYAGNHVNELIRNSTGGACGTEERMLACNGNTTPNQPKQSAAAPVEQPKQSTAAPVEQPKQ
jgi:hypothetical protein